MEINHNATVPPVLQGAGFHDLALADESLDHERATDIQGNYGYGKSRIAVRSRNPQPHRYSPKELDDYKRQFTIRYSRPTGVPTEWEKLFSKDFPYKPDYLAYGWVDDENRALNEWVIIDLSELRRLHEHGFLKKYEENLKTNIDARRSSFVALPIHELARLAPRTRLVPWHSPNHPALTFPRSQVVRDSPIITQDHTDNPFKPRRGNLG